ncbi:GNAT family N-acetyltransferase [Actinacidiphila bryophytorum]|uniref:GNAT family N-acetyltransferase n=1 Tax=Actinacidiphila bryophytorum TaxID=1436133 RepID=A0A9W4H4X0_9ACTN|nr:GNAT family N-acetyltransferase [Actinacidiphila bryophytorum]MBM9435681.1 N-acetyltransferase [Actinacidiphila bryophytorum]MBN6545950.1 N-acetyltransferase [Actinacidiphila bryophytorum]CAG7650748.1 GNAT family N-acetyltransferase [Actinacidiphila bryophytorum]
MTATTRTAVPGDLPAVLALAAELRIPGCPSGAGLEQAVRDGLVRVAEVLGETVGLAVLERPLPGHVRLACIGVVTGRRRRGVGSALLGHVLAEARGTETAGGTVSCVADPGGTALAGLLLAHGFLGTRTLRTGPGGRALRLYYQHKVRVEYVDPDARHLVPVADAEQLADSLAPDDHAVTALAVLSGEPAFEISRFERDDPSALQSGEAQAGIAFSGSVLASLTFLVGFSFASSHYPDDVRLLLIVATFVTTMSLIVYASAAGELARIRSNAFGRIMKWGNVLSEYGGVLPFLASLPITYAQLSASAWLTVLTGLAFSAGLALYERSEFSIAHRFRWTPWSTALAAVTSLAPAASVITVAAGLPSWPSTAVLMTALAARAAVYLFRRGAESGVAVHRRVWQIRQ